MKTKVAVSTVQGKAYFLIVNELKRIGISFLSLIPGEHIRTEIRVVITTDREKYLIDHHKILVYDVNSEPEILGNEIVRILQGKESYEQLVIGVDPGLVIGLAVLADSVIIDRENCASIEATIIKIKKILKNIDYSKSTITIKIGSGVPIYKELLEKLCQTLPIQVCLEIVNEVGTNRYNHEEKNRRGLRHIVSATRIARRAGYEYSRSKTIETNN